MENANIEYDPAQTGPRELIATVRNAGFDVAVEKTTLSIEGMTCAACAARIEKQLAKRPEIIKAQVNLALERAEIAHIAGANLREIIQTIRDAGFDAHPHHGDMARRARQEEELRQRQQAEKRRDMRDLAIAALCSAPLLAQMLAMFAGLHFSLPPWLELALATPVQFYVGRRFYRGAWAALRSGGANMDVLVAMGTSAAYFFSLYMLLRLGEGARGHLYFEASAVIITLILLGKILEARARRGTTAAIRELMKLRPATARRRREDGGEEEIPIEDIVRGDIVVIKPGENVPVDGEILEGRSQCDESLLTGESLPVDKKPGDMVTGGAINGAGRLVVRPLRTGSDSTLGRIISLVESAQSGKAPVQRLVDRVAGIFVPVVIAIAALTFAGWMIAGAGFENALIAAVAVLVIACPCALGLATPTAIVAGTGAAAREGILFRNVEALETAHKTDVVAFDKTGTLTLGEPELVKVRARGMSEEELILLAAAVQAASQHPLAGAILKRAREMKLEPLPAVSDFQSIAGKGVEGMVDGRHVVIGNPALMRERGPGPDEDMMKLREEWHASGQSVIFVMIDGEMAGLMAIADPLRPQSREAVRMLQERGVRAIMLSGDAKAAAAHIAAQAGLEDYRGEVRPQDKAEEIGRLQAQGHVVAMVGDGINDAPALALADLGVAMGSGSDVAMETAGVTLMRSDPRLVAAALDISGATWRKLWQNLFWAFIYNIIGIPLAASGMLSPALAGAAMAMSSISVVSNSLLLRRWRAGPFDSPS
jgi:Cu+-exporting ATPase